MKFIDQIGHSVIIDPPPERIVSLVPSQTELLSYFGLDDEVVGITKFCIHPENWFRTKTRVGGTKKLNFDKIKELNPDLIICNKEENTESDVKALMEKYPVWTSDIHNLHDAYNMISSLGEITGNIDPAEELVLNIKTNFEELHNELRFLTPLRSVRNDNGHEGFRVKGAAALPPPPSPLSKQKPVIPNEVRNLNINPLRALYLIWKDPYMAAGKDTFIDAMMAECNLINVCAPSPQVRYPELTLEQIKNLNPDVILLSSEPYPFKEKHIEEFNLYYPGVLTVLVDGEYFSWYGSRLLYAPHYFKSLFNIIVKV